MACCKTSPNQGTRWGRRERPEKGDAVCLACFRFRACEAEQLFTISSQFTVRSDEAVERLPGNPEFLTKIAHTGFRFPNYCMRETHLGRGHLEATTAMSSSCAG